MKARFDPTTLEIYRALFTSVAEEMGVALRRTAFSPNIKERSDYSCAVFDAAGTFLALYRSPAPDARDARAVPVLVFAG